MEKKVVKIRKKDVCNHSKDPHVHAMYVLVSTPPEVSTFAILDHSVVTLWPKNTTIDNKNLNLDFCTPVIILHESPRLGESFITKDKDSKPALKHNATEADIANEFSIRVLAIGEEIHIGSLLGLIKREIEEKDSVAISCEEVDGEFQLKTDENGYVVLTVTKPSMGGIIGLLKDIADTMKERAEKQAAESK